MPMDERYIYIVFSSTHSKMGKMIRAITGETYNHVSIALDKDLTRMYSFARRYYRTPLYGGFVRESLSRYYQEGQAAHICVCRVPVSDDQHRRLDALLTEMFENREHYLYNYLSAIFSPLHRRVPTRDAYTCIEFCVQILCGLGMQLDPAQYYSVCTVMDKLREFIIYNGPVKESIYDDAYFAKKPVHCPAWVTARDMLKLLTRLDA